MKKIFLTLAIAATSLVSAFAQDDFSIGARVGMNVANIGGDVEDLDAKIGLKFGVVADFSLVDNVFLEVGAFYSPKGAKREYSEELPLIGKFNYDYIIKLNYLEIPISGVYKYEINDNLAVRGHFGPYLGFGLFGKEKLEINGSVSNSDGNGESGYKEKAFSSKSDDCNYKRFDVGLNFGAGMEFGSCYLGVQYGLGLANFNSKNSKDIKMRNGVFAVEFGYNFAN